MRGLRSGGTIALAAMFATLAACATVGARRERAIGRAEAFLQKRGTAIDPLMTFVLARLERRWALSWTAAQRSATLAATPATPQRALFARLVDPAAHVDPAALATIQNVSDRLILSALYCRDVPGASLEALAPWAERDGTDVSHGAMALRWLVENGCVAATDAEPLRQRYIAGLVTEAGNHRDADRGIEAMAMLDYLGAADRIAPAWIDAILSAQHGDGGWGERPAERSNDHTTVLALWVLLAASRPPVTDLPWIPAA